MAYEDDATTLEDCSAPLQHLNEHLFNFTQLNLP